MSKRRFLSTAAAARALQQPRTTTAAAAAPRVASAAAAAASSAEESIHPFTRPPPPATTASAATAAVEAAEERVRHGLHVSGTSLTRLLTHHRCSADLALVRRVHALGVLTGAAASDAYLANQLIRAYAAHGCLPDAAAVFAGVPAPNAFAWRSIIAAHADLGHPRRALALFHALVATCAGTAAGAGAGVRPNDYVLVAAVRAAAGAGDLAAGERVHGHVRESGMEGNPFVATALIDMYAKCGGGGDGEVVAATARAVFDGVTAGRRTAALWTAMMGAYVALDCGRAALALYDQMRTTTGLVEEDRATVVVALKACAATGALAATDRVRDRAARLGLLPGDPAVAAALVGAYAGAGDVRRARAAFSDAAKRAGPGPWTALVKAHGQRGDVGAALACVDEMRAHGVAPDAATVTCVLAACSRAGAVEAGERVFLAAGVLAGGGEVGGGAGVEVAAEHWNCMVDLYARAGRLDDAEQMLVARDGSGSSAASAAGWRALLSACGTYGDVERAGRCFQAAVRAAPADPAAYALMSSVYAAAGRWEEVERVRQARAAAGGGAKKPAKAVIEVRGEVHEFVVGGGHGSRLRREGEQVVYEAARAMSARAKRHGGHVPQVGSLVVRPGRRDEDKEAALCGHAEKLAIAFGLMHTPQGQPLRVVKNLRMCGDCHASTKVVSRVERREITVRDGFRVHHFEDGACSCQD